MVTSKRKYSKEFKVEAVRLALQGNRPMSEAAQELGVHPNILYKWVREHKSDPGQAFPGKGLLHHSDRGVQYASDDYQALLTQYGMICSMNRKGDFWDSAMTESFFAILESHMS